jgi:hypothetical protein
MILNTIKIARNAFVECFRLYCNNHFILGAFVGDPLPLNNL